MIFAHLYLDDDHPLGFHQFAGVPNHGDRVHIAQGDDVLILTVERVDHYPVPAKNGAANIFGSTKPAITVYCGVGED